MHGTVCNYILIYAHLNGIYIVPGMGSDCNNEWYSVCVNPCELSDHLTLLEGYQLIHVWSKKFYKSLTNYDFSVAMGGLLLQLENFKKVKLIFGHPVQLCWIVLTYCFRRRHHSRKQDICRQHTQ